MLKAFTVSAMISQPQNPEFRNNPENFHCWVKESCVGSLFCGVVWFLVSFLV